VSLGSQGIAFKYVVALLIGRVAAAPLAAWLVRYITPALLGASAGGLILITNTRTMFDAYGVAADVRDPVYMILGAVWVLALAFVVQRLRRDGEPLLNRKKAELATERG